MNLLAVEGPAPMIPTLAPYPLPVFTVSSAQKENEEPPM